MAQRLGLNIKHRPGLSVCVANGERVTSPGVCVATTLDIHGEPFVVDCYALPLDGFNVVLGVRWLQTLGPIVWDFTKLFMSFCRDGRRVSWTGLGSPGLSLHAIASNCDVLAALLASFQDIFKEPTSLPPP